MFNVQFFTANKYREDSIEGERILIKTCLAQGYDHCQHVITKAFSLLQDANTLRNIALKNNRHVQTIKQFIAIYLL